MKYFLLLLLLNTYNTYSQKIEKNYIIIDSNHISIGLTDDKKAAILILKNQVSKTIEGCKVWVDFVYGQLLLKNKKYPKGYMRCLYILNCDEKKLKMIKALYYTSNNILISEAIVNSPEWEDAIPFSVGEGILNKSCELLNGARY